MKQIDVNKKEIEELERTLLLKKAYLSAKVSFTNAKNFPADVKKEVESKLKESALKLASGETIVKSEESSDFTPEQIEALKLLATSVISKQQAKGAKDPTPPAQPTTNNQAQTPPPKPQGIGEGTLLYLDNVPINQRRRVDSGATVIILSEKEDKFFVQDPKGNRFWIPQEDIQR